MSTPTDYLQHLLAALRSKPTGPPNTAAGAPKVQSQLDGYRLHVKEAQAMGDQPLPYDEWLKQQPRLETPQE